MVRITIEGPRAVGKSFVAVVLQRALTAMGYEVVMHSSIHPQVVPDSAKGMGKVFIQERWMPRD